MKTFFFFLLFGVASAHMPVFNNNLLNKNVIDKSWSVYETMKAGETLLLRLNITAGENFSISVNMDGTQNFEENVNYVNVSVTGHNAQSIECDPRFNGWRVLSGAHEAGIVDETKIIPTTTVAEPLHFEPFGVGYYRKLAACQGNVTVSDVFNVTIVALKDIRLNVGVGLVEMFSFTDIVFMSISIVRVWWWSGYFVPWVIFTSVITLFLIYYYREILRKACVSCRGTVNFVQSKDVDTSIVRSVLFFNAIQFVLRLIVINFNNYEKDVDFMIFFPIGVHIVLPLVVAWVWGKFSHGPTAFFLLLIYTSALLWQGFFVVPVFCFFKLLTAFIKL